MMKRILLLSILLAAVFGVLAGCGSTEVKDYIAETYPLVDVVESQVNTDDESFIYRAENKSVVELSKELSEQEKPTETSEYNNGKQVLIYDNQFVILTQDPNNSDHTLVEVSTENFVRDNYNPSFFQGMLIGHILSDMFGGRWERNQNARCRPNDDNCYNGYGSSGGGYYGSWGSGSSSGRGSTFRGGGPGTGK
jgi:hypothetical protein